jgi:hypothetical protein
LCLPSKCEAWSSNPCSTNKLQIVVFHYWQRPTVNPAVISPKSKGHMLCSSLTAPQAIKQTQEVFWEEEKPL